jgi:hypothetical protein
MLPSNLNLINAMPKLTLRDLFAVVSIVALALGWALDRARLSVEKAQAHSEAERSQKRVTILKGELEDLGGEVTIGEKGVSVFLPGSGTQYHWTYD